MLNNTELTKKAAEITKKVSLAKEQKEKLYKESAAIIFENILDDFNEVIEDNNFSDEELTLIYFADKNALKPKHDADLPIEISFKIDINFLYFLVSFINQFTGFKASIIQNMGIRVEIS